MSYDLEEMKNYLKPDKELIRKGDLILQEEKVSLDGIIDAFTLMAEGLSNIAKKAAALKKDIPVERHGEIEEALEYSLDPEVTT